MSWTCCYVKSNLTSLKLHHLFATLYIMVINFGGDGLKKSMHTVRDAQLWYPKLSHLFINDKELGEFLNLINPSYLEFGVKDDCLSPKR